jgi:hypothetical protein
LILLGFCYSIYMYTLSKQLAVCVLNIYVLLIVLLLLLLLLLVLLLVLVLLYIIYFITLGHSFQSPITQVVPGLSCRMY